MARRIKEERQEPQAVTTTKKMRAKQATADTTTAKKRHDNPRLGWTFNEDFTLMSYNGENQ